MMAKISHYANNKMIILGFLPCLCPQYASIGRASSVSTSVLSELYRDNQNAS